MTAEQLDPTASDRRLRRAAAWTAAGTLAASLAMYLLYRRGGLTVGLFRFQDFPILLLGSGLLLFLAFRPGPAVKPLPWRPALVAGLLAAAVLIVAAGGTWIVFGNFPLTRDEILADFDAGFIAQGHLIGPIAAEWRPFAPALMPQFMLPVAAEVGWLSGYLPGNAALRAIGEATFGAAWVSPPGVGAGSGSCRPRKAARAHPRRGQAC